MKARRSDRDANAEVDDDEPKANSKAKDDGARATPQRPCRGIALAPRDSSLPQSGREQQDTIPPAAGYESRYGDSLSDNGRSRPQRKKSGPGARPMAFEQKIGPPPYGERYFPTNRTYISTQREIPTAYSARDVFARPCARSAKESKSGR